MSSQLDQWQSPAARTHPAGRGGRLQLGAEPLRGRGVKLAALATAAAHLLFLSRWLSDDEGGFAMVARFWHEPGPYLYGPLWVDRPPGLIAVFDAARSLGPLGPRLVAGAVAVVAVLAAADAATALAGRSAGFWAAWAAFAFYSSPLLQAHILNGELVASTAVLLSVAAALRADRVVRSPAAVSALACLAGVAAGAAVLVKQSFVDGIVFGTVLLGLRVVRSRPWRREAVPILAFVAGAAFPLVVTVAWAVSRGSFVDLVYAVGDFRFDAAAVMASWSASAPTRRLVTLVLLALVSGLGLLLAASAAASWRRLRQPSRVGWAVVLTAGVELLGVAAGGNYWAHYLIGLLPMTVLVAGVVAATPERWTRRLVVAAGAVTVASLPVAAVAAHLEPPAAVVGGWVGASADPSDSITVLYTHPNVAEFSGLAPAYPYAWSLPLRTLDPELRLLTATLEGSRAPTWVVQWDDPDTWNLDADHRLEDALDARYRKVAEVCGHPVLLLRGAQRDLAPLPLSPCLSTEGLP